LGGLNYLYGQLTNVTNKHFSIGSYGRVGIARGDDNLYPRSLNLNGMGSMGGRNEEADYFELATALHFTPISKNTDTTSITIQSRLAFYTTQGQIIGNVNSNSFGGITTNRWSSGANRWHCMDGSLQLEHAGDSLGVSDS
jgi:maltoporin